MLYALSHRDLQSFPTRRSSDLLGAGETGVLPGHLYQYGGSAPEVEAGTALYRINAGGPGMAATDGGPSWLPFLRSEEHTSELQSRGQLACRLLLENKKNRLTNK